MGTLETVLLMLLVIDAITLGVLVLLQQGKGADIGAAFGSGSANTVFGSAGSASFLAKLTAWLAMGFFLISFGLAYTAKERALSLRDEGMPLVSTDSAAPAAAPNPVEQSAAPPVTAPPAGATAAPEPQAPAQLTEPKEPVGSDIPDV